MTFRDWLGSLWRRGRTGSPPRADTGARAGTIKALPPQASGVMATAAPVSLAQARCTVVIPALNEAARIADVVRYALADPLTAEVAVIDDSSIDDTAQLAREAGARVVRSTMLGKGTSMRDGAQAAEHELVVYLDGDLHGLRPGIISDLLQPLRDGEADFVKARFGRGGGRVTELTAKPMLKVFFPELSHVAQPLGGIIAARRTLLRTLAFEDGYGVDIGLLIDAHRAGARVVEVDIGSLAHDSQPLLDLAVMANEVARVIFLRARAAGRLHVEQIVQMHEVQRLASASIEYILSRRRARTRILLLDMDGTVSPQRFVVELARVTGNEEALKALLDSPQDDAATRSERIAALFRFVHRSQFEKVAHALTLRPGVIEWVNLMRRRGFMVGLVSDSWFVGAEIVRRRLFADFALAHTLQFDGDVCTGELRINPAFLPPEPPEPAGGPAGARRIRRLASSMLDAFGPGDGNKAPTLCKSHVVARFRTHDAEPRVDLIWAVGDNLNDVPMLRAADRAFLIEPKSSTMQAESGATPITSFEELLDQAPQPPAVPAAAPAEDTEP